MLKSEGREVKGEERETRDETQGVSREYDSPRAPRLSPLISVVMPTLNEEKAIGTMIEQIRTHAADYETEIVVVDSSTDRTPEIARELGARVIRQPKQGHGLALRRAIQEATHDIIITTDCDNTYPLDYIPQLVDLVERGGYDIVSCNRLTKQLGKEMPWLNKLGNKTFALMVRMLYGIPVHDVTTGMFCLRKKVSEAIPWETNYAFPCELIVRAHLAGFRHKEIDIPYKIRIGEVTLNRWRSGKAYLRCITKYRFNLGFHPSTL
jgi:glycosyltransferase involved in cell wall biosynthesis